MVSIETEGKSLKLASVVVDMEDILEESSGARFWKMSRACQINNREGQRRKGDL